MTEIKKKGSLGELIKAGKQTEQNIKNENPSKVDAPAIEPIVAATHTDNTAKEEIKPNSPIIDKPEVILEEKSAISFDDILKKNDYGVGEQVIRIPSSLHFELKVLATYTNSTINSIIANVLDNFLKENSKEIKKKIRK